jgi:cell division protein FtsB
MRALFKLNTLLYTLYILLILGLVYFSIFGNMGLIKFYELKKGRTKLAANIHELEERIEKLEEEKARLTKPAYLEHVIREKLGYIKEGEKVYQITTK